MTHSSHRFTTLSADDVALCRAHSEAIEQDGYSRMLVAEVFVVESEFKRSGRAVLPADLPMPPSYSEDLEQWLAQRESERVHEAVLERQRSARSVAPAKPAAPEAPFPAPPQLPPVPGLALADLHVYIRDLLASTSSAADGAALIGTKPAAPAQHPAQKASTHSVCIKAHKSMGLNRDIGTVVPRLPHHRSHPECWLPCDESGWVTHVPTADSVCPVPDDVAFEAKWRNGKVCSLDNIYLRGETSAWSLFGNDLGLVAWRPIAQS